MLYFWPGADVAFPRHAHCLPRAGPPSGLDGLDCLCLAAVTDTSPLKPLTER